MRIRIALVGVLALIATAILVSELSCNENYAITIDLSPTENPAYPYTVSGSVVGCGIRRLEGESQFKLMLRPGAARSGMRSTLGRSTVEVEAGVSADGRTGWYVATVTRNEKVVASKRAQKQLP
jgi:hypothetical protein